MILSEPWKKSYYEKVFREKEKNIGKPQVQTVWLLYCETLYVYNKITNNTKSASKSDLRMFIYNKLIKKRRFQGVI